jgi:hypothetical protein
VEVLEFCLFLVVFPARCVSSISPRFHFRKHAFCFLPLVTILESFSGELSLPSKISDGNWCINIPAPPPLNDVILTYIYIVPCGFPVRLNFILTHDGCCLPFLVSFSYFPSISPLTSKISCYTQIVILESTSRGLKLRLGHLCKMGLVKFF